MSSSWFSSPREIHVEDPGHGVVLVGSDQPTPDGTHIVAVRGSQLGAALASVTALALSDDPASARVSGFGSITRSEARQLLPALQAAVMLAVGGTDRAERVRPLEDDAAPLEPVCVTCGEGSQYTPTMDSTNPRCAEYGHHPFGEYDGLRWDAALCLHRSNADWWEQTRALGHLRA
ncbi:hypothetical protein [Nocardioides sp. AX2bis]|uniref:hypothetical protein n=1 Tax=Nocardioides sp. AX2bis TaxID=2653157 RepID=UPI00135A3E6A|nr:hypothetical protein [Nocardioides sp. AX2bis]